MIYYVGIIKGMLGIEGTLTLKYCAPATPADTLDVTTYVLVSLVHASIVAPRLVPYRTGRKTIHMIQHSVRRACSFAEATQH